MAVAAVAVAVAAAGVAVSASPFATRASWALGIQTRVDQTGMEVRRL